MEYNAEDKPARDTTLAERIEKLEVLVRDLDVSLNHAWRLLERVWGPQPKEAEGSALARRF